MKIINFGNYTLKASMIDMYKVEDVGPCTEERVVTLYLTNGEVIKDIISDEVELEELTDELYRAMEKGE